MNNRRCLAGLGLLCALLIGLTAQISIAQEQTGKVVRVRGANVMASMCDSWSKTFAESNPGITVVVSGGGTADGFEALFDKTAELTMASRTILEKEVQAAALSGCKVTELQITRTPVAIITHPDNPVKELTLDQLRMILTGEYTRWSDVAGPNEPISLVTSQPISGTALFLRSHVMQDEFFSSEAKARDYYHGIIKEISLRKPPAVGYAGLIDAERGVRNKQVKILSIKKDSTSPAVAPSVETLKDGSYPLILSLYLYWDAQSAGPHVKRFVEFCKKRAESLR